jgi:hypothetical protein
MIGFFRDFRDRVRGVGNYAITVPPMDGTLRPNQDLEEADVLLKVDGPANLCDYNGSLFFSSGKDVKRLDPNGTTLIVKSFSCEITALALDPKGALAVALTDGSLHLPDGYSAGGLTCNFRCVTALAFDANGACFLACGSETNLAKAWPRDLLERNSSGSVWRLDAGGRATCLARGLSWPAGLLPDFDGTLLVTEASCCRLIRVTEGAAPSVVMSNLTGYPAGIAAVSESGYVLSIMAPRNQLIEFILREREYVKEMIEKTPSNYWIAPSMKAPESFLEPLQGGALKQLGIMKPWAPSRSIGLVVRLNGEFIPIASHHSRADGRNHGTISAIEWNGTLVVASLGNDRILKLQLNGGHP